MQFGDIKYDSNGIISFSINNGNRTYHNPFMVALQAMIGDRILDDYSKDSVFLIPRYIPVRYLYDTETSDSQIRAIKWMLDNCTKKENSFCWQYEYPVEYAGTSLQEGWVSAYAQAYAALAFLVFFHNTKEEVYKEYCLGALFYIIKSVNDGGCLFSFSDYEIWFEEIPGDNPTHIFNAHIISLLAIAEVKEELKINSFDRFFKAGILALIKRIDYMDTGTMSAYDIPNELDIQLLVDFDNVDDEEQLFIKNITFDDGNKCHVIKVNNRDTGLEINILKKVLRGYRIIRKADFNGKPQGKHIYFSDIRTNKARVVFTIEYEANKDIQIKLKKNSIYGFVEIGGGKRILLKKDEHQKDIVLPINELFNDVHRVYHEYHIIELTELNRFIRNDKIKLLLKCFYSYKYLNKKRQQLGAIINIEPQIKALSVVVNTECGLRCKMCDIGTGNAEASIVKFLKGESRNQLDPDLLIKRCKEAGEVLETVHFVGTEPTLYVHLGYAIEEIKRLGKKIIVTTNGINLKNTLSDMINKGVDCIQISIDGPSRIHDDIRGRKGLFGSIIQEIYEHKEEIEALRKRGGKIVASCAISPLNYMHLEELVDTLADAGFSDLWCTHMNFVDVEIAKCHNVIHSDFPIGCSTINDEVDPQKIDPWKMYCSIRRAKERADKRGIGFIESPCIEDCFGYEDFYHRPTTILGATICAAPFRTLQVNADGRICVMSRCYNIDIGNINEISLNDAITSPALRRLRSCIINENQWDPCKRCCAIM